MGLGPDEGMEMTNKINIGLAAMALCATVCTSPAYAAGATRSAQVLPMMAASVGSVAYKPGLENQWRCAKVTDKALKLKKKAVQVDTVGRVVLNPQGAPFACRLAPSNYRAGAPGAGGFPVAIVGGIAVVGGTIIAVAGTGNNNDSPG